MNILFVTNYFPPCQFDWGYMQLCEETVEGLAARNHNVAVLTSVYRHGEEIGRDYPVYRLLAIDPDWNSNRPGYQQFFFGRKARERKAVQCLQRIAAEIEPDIIFVWHGIGLSRLMLQKAETLPGIQVVYYLANYLPELPDEYMRYWQSEAVGFPAGLIKKILSPLVVSILVKEGKPISLKFANTICVSDYVRTRLVKGNLIPDRARVIHNGIDLSTFSSSPKIEFGENSRPVHCLVSGRIAKEKGVHTVVEAFLLLKENGNARDFFLTILGEGESDYCRALSDRVAEVGLDQMIEFKSPVPREEMPAVLADHDILILPSEYAEPLARAGQEAMGMGLLVIGTTTGGSGELLLHEETGLVFEAGCPESLAVQLSRVLSEPQLLEKVVTNGHRRVVEYFNLSRMMAEIEAYLLNLLGQDQR